MDRATRFRPNVPKVVHQTIDGEVVIINLDSGCYYSLENVAADVWTAVEMGASLAEAAEMLGKHYAVAPDTITAALETFVGSLYDESLLVEAPGAAAPASLDGAIMVSRRGAAFQPPALRKYTDMQDLLLIDPIHEVDDLGWPGVKAKGREH
jgi:hypothetical protein